MAKTTTIEGRAVKLADESGIVPRLTLTVARADAESVPNMMLKNHVITLDLVDGIASKRGKLLIVPRRKGEKVSQKIAGAFDFATGTIDLGKLDGVLDAAEVSIVRQAIEWAGTASDQILAEDA